MSFNQYDPGLVVLAFRGVQILGYAEGTFIEAERTEDTFSMHVGAGGDVTRVRKRNPTGSVKVTLMQASPSNDVLSSVAIEDEAFGTGTGVLMLKDLLGNTILESPVAWIKKPAKTDFGADATPREWTFDCAQLVGTIGGAVVQV